MSKQYVELEDENSEDKNIIRDIKEKKAIYSRKKKNLSNTSKIHILSITLILVIIIFSFCQIQLIKKYDQKISSIEEKLKFFISKENIPQNQINSINDALISNTKKSNELQRNFSNLKRDIIFLESTTILQKIAELELIEGGVEKKMQKNIKKIQKLYQATVDGDSSKKFHEKCDNIRNTLVIIKDDANRRYGGFTTETWNDYDGKTNYKKDLNAFIFSIDTKNFYDVVDYEHAILCANNFGPTFGGGHEIHVSNKCTQNNFSYGRTDKKYYDFKGDKNKEGILDNRNGEGHYIKDYEVFSVSFE